MADGRRRFTGSTTPGRQRRQMKVQETTPPAAGQSAPEAGGRNLRTKETYDKSGGRPSACLSNSSPVDQACRPPCERTLESDVCCAEDATHDLNYSRHGKKRNEI